MHRPILAAALAAFAVAPLAAQSPAPPVLPALDADQQAQLTCSAAFAVVASEQARGVESALAWPPLKVRGREYFVRFGARTIDATGASREAVRALLEGEVARLQKLAVDNRNPDGAVASVIRPCLDRLDAEVPPLPKPTLAQCASIMALAYEEVYAKEGLNGAEARDLKILAAVLEARQRKALEAQQLSGGEIDRRIAEAHDAMLKEALAEGPGVERYDLAACYDLAKPEKTAHY